HSQMALAARAGVMLVRRSGEWAPGETHIATPQERWHHTPRAFVALPLLTPDGVSGVVALWSAGDRPLDASGLELLQLLGPFAGLQLKHARAFHDLRVTADHDPLTGL